MILETKFFYLVVYIASASLLTALAGWAYIQPDERGSKAFIGVVIGCAIWSYGSLFQLIAPTWPLRIVAMKLEITGVFLIPPTWFFFTLQFTNNEHHITDRLKYVVYSYFVIFTVLAWTNEIHWLMWADYMFNADPFPMVAKDEAMMYWISYMVGYGAVFAGLGYIIRLSFTTGRPYRSQALALVGGILSIMAANLASTAGILPIEEVDLSPAGTAMFALLMMAAVYRARFLDIVPIARRRVLNEINDIVIVLDERDRVADVNISAEPLLDDNEEEYLGVPASEALPEPVHDAIETGKQTIELSVDGEERHYNIEKKPIETDDKVVGSSIMLHDITELKENEAELRRQNDRLEEFASTVSHDLRSPLNVASAYTDMAREDPKDEHFDTVEDSLDRMEDIIEDVLTLAREGQTVSDPEPVNLQEIATEAWERVDNPDDVGIDVDGDVAIEADQSRLQNVFENLYRNSLEHNDPPLDLKVGLLEDRNGFYVEDTGSGVPEDAQDEIFEHGVTSNEDGTGLGLAIVNSIGEAHGWSVSVKNNDDHGGARFEFTGVDVQ